MYLIPEETTGDLQYIFFQIVFQILMFKTFLKWKWMKDIILQFTFFTTSHIKGIFVRAYRYILFLLLAKNYSKIWIFHIDGQVISLFLFAILVL